MLLADGGVENCNGAVDELIQSGLLKRVLARTEITFSNSLIESWWRVLKRQWLYLNTLDAVSTVEKLVRFYVQEHNTPDYSLSRRASEQARGIAIFPRLRVGLVWIRFLRGVLGKIATTPFH